MAEKATTDYSAKVKAVKNDYKKAAKICPKIIQSLKAGMPELERNKLTAKLNLSYKLIADCESASLHHQDAANYYKKLIEVEPQVARWHVAYAESSYRAGNTGEALRASHLATQLDPKKFEHRLLEARLLTKAKLYPKAILAYQVALKIAPFNQVQHVQNELNHVIALKNDVIQQKIEETELMGN